MPYLTENRKRNFRTIPIDLRLLLFRDSIPPMDIEQFIDRQDITLTEFARRSGIPRSTLETIMSGGGCRTVTLGKLMAVSGGLITFSDLMPTPKDEEE